MSLIRRLVCASVDGIVSEISLSSKAQGSRFDGGFTEFRLTITLHHEFFTTPVNPLFYLEICRASEDIGRSTRSSAELVENQSAVGVGQELPPLLFQSSFIFSHSPLVSRSAFETFYSSSAHF